MSMISCINSGSASVCNSRSSLNCPRFNNTFLGSNAYWSMSFISFKMSSSLISGMRAKSASVEFSPSAPASFSSFSSSTAAGVSSALVSFSFTSSALSASTSFSAASLTSCDFRVDCRVMSSAHTGDDTYAARVGWISTRLLDRVWNAQLATSVTPSAARRRRRRRSSSSRITPIACLLVRLYQPPRPRRESVGDMVGWRHPVPFDRAPARGRRGGRRVRVRVVFAATRALDVDW
mmetsp:Transcript_785/g.2511  ORF Transcript_785/g.2511 Transcript_785/m.2511 type:complete len:235 (+) Transcript_785:460-1164(+)